MTYDILQIYIHIFFLLKFVVMFLYWCYYPHKSRDSVPPVGGIFSLTSMESQDFYLVSSWNRSDVFCIFYIKEIELTK